jgi:hypothetical protein
MESSSLATKADGKSQKRVDGDNLLYRLLTDLIKQGGPSGQWLIDHIVADCSVWWDPQVYGKCPVLLPWAVRDPKCRGNKTKGIPDEWGAPNRDGYFRDDNSLVKSLVKSLQVRGPNNGYMTGRKLGKGWVAAHIWRVNDGEILASRDPRLYTFVPNLVWLPRQIAKLSDIEGGPVQAALKSLSFSLYRDAPVNNNRREIAEQSWEYLTAPKSVSTIERESLSFFTNPDVTVGTRTSRTIDVVAALEAAAQGDVAKNKAVSTRYSDGLASIEPSARQNLIWELKRHI